MNKFTLLLACCLVATGSVAYAQDGISGNSMTMGKDAMSGGSMEKQAVDGGMMKKDAMDKSKMEHKEHAGKMHKKKMEGTKGQDAMERKQ